MRWDLTDWPPHGALEEYQKETLPPVRLWGVAVGFAYVAVAGAISACAILMFVTFWIHHKLVSQYNFDVLHGKRYSTAREAVDAHAALSKRFEMSSRHWQLFFAPIIILCCIVEIGEIFMFVTGSAYFVYNVITFVGVALALLLMLILMVWINNVCVALSKEFGKAHEVFSSYVAPEGDPQYAEQRSLQDRQWFFTYISHYWISFTVFGFAVTPTFVKAAATSAVTALVAVLLSKFSTFLICVSQHSAPNSTFVNATMHMNITTCELFGFSL